MFRVSSRRPYKRPEAVGYVHEAFTQLVLAGNKRMSLSVDLCFPEEVIVSRLSCFSGSAPLEFKLHQALIPSMQPNKTEYASIQLLNYTSLNMTLEAILITKITPT